MAVTIEDEVERSIAKRPRRSGCNLADLDAGSRKARGSKGNIRVIALDRLCGWWQRSKGRKELAAAGVDIKGVASGSNEIRREVAI
jgi:hypothetical protein